MKDMAFEEFIEKVKTNCDILNIISEYVQLKKRGKDYWGCCPFHNEKTPSFSVSPEKGFFYCFGCHSGGNVFNFIMKIENLTFFEAVKFLAQKVNIPLPAQHKTEYEIRAEREANRLFKANEMASAFFNACLTKTGYGEHALQYLIKRGLSLETINYFKLGYALKAWDKLYNSLINRGIDAETLVKAGLVIAKETENDNYYDRFRNRIMFPICDARGRVAGFGGRVLDDGVPKYLNTPETTVFNKRQILFGFDKALAAIKTSGEVIVVEGYMDVISLYNVGINNAVASLGTAFSAEQARILANVAKNVYFAYDSDAAGQNATLRALLMMRAYNVTTKVIEIPDGKDPDEYVRRHGKESFLELLNTGIGVFDFVLQQAVKKYDYSNLEGKIQVVAEMLPHLALINNAVEINFYITKIAQLLVIDESAIRSELNKYMAAQKKDNIVKVGKTNNIAKAKKDINKANIKAEEQLIRLMLDDNSIIPYVMTQIDIEYIEDEDDYQIINLIYNAYNTGNPIDAASLILELERKTSERLSYIVMREFNVNDLTKVVDDCIKSIKLHYLQKEYELHRIKAEQLESMGDNGYLKELEKIQRIKDEIKLLYVEYTG